VSEKTYGIGEKISFLGTIQPFFITYRHVGQINRLPTNADESASRLPPEGAVDLLTQAFMIFPAAG
jgi:hypothetical protein